MLLAKEAQEKISKYLSVVEQPDSDGHPSSLILLGEKGIGKRFLADTIAKKLLATDSLATCPDYCLVESEKGAILIDHLENVKLRSNYFSVTGEYKVYVIDDADTMNDYSQNSLLKLLEEGNATNIFVFVAHKSLLSTIHSRCQTIQINIPSDEEIQDYFIENGLELDRDIMKMASNRVGLYHQLIADEKYTEDIKVIVNRFIKLEKKRDLLEAFGLVKEKGDFFEVYSLEKVQLFMKRIRDLFSSALYFSFGISDGKDYTNVVRHYDSQKCMDIISLINKHVERMAHGRYTKNDFFDLIRYMVS